MNSCCISKLKAVLVILDMKDKNYERLEKQFEKEHKTSMKRTAEHLAVISYRKEISNTKNLIEMFIKEGV